MSDEPVSDMTLPPLRIGDDTTEALANDGRTITVGAIVRNCTGGPSWLVDAISTNGGGALLHLVSPQARNVRATFYADRAVLAPPERDKP